MAKRLRRSKRNWSEAAFVANTLLFIMLAVGCGSADPKGAPAPAPAKAPDSTPKPAAKAEQKAPELKVVEPKVETNAPVAGIFKLYSVEAWQKQQAEKKTNSAAAQPTNTVAAAEYVTPSMRPVIPYPTIPSVKLGAPLAVATKPATIASAPQVTTPKALAPSPVKPTKSTKPAKPVKAPARASTAVLEKSVLGLVYTHGDIWNTHWSSDPDFNGLGLYPDMPRDEIIGVQFTKFLETKGPMTRDLLVAAYDYAQHGSEERNWQFFTTQDHPPARILGARYVLGILCELDRQNHGELLKVTAAEVFKLINERPLLTSYTDERNLCPAL